MKIQFSKGRRFQSFPVGDDNVEFLPGDRWEFTTPGKWVKNKDCTFIANGLTKQDAKAIDYTQKVHLRVVDVKTKDIVHTQISRFYPDDKIAGKKVLSSKPLCGAGKSGSPKRRTTSPF